MQRWLISLTFGALVGCSGTNMPKAEPPLSEKTRANIRAALDKLDPADRQAAEAQRWCAVSHGNRLGGMGTPYKMMIEGRPVFLCCEGCKDDAAANPEKTLAAVAELKAKAAETP